MAGRHGIDEPCIRLVGRCADVASPPVSDAIYQNRDRPLRAPRLDPQDDLPARPRPSRGPGRSMPSSTSTTPRRSPWAAWSPRPGA